MELADQPHVAEQAGVRRVEIVSSQSPGKRGDPIDDDVLARLQVRVDDLAEIFLQDVARYRGVSADKVMQDFGQGDVLIGDKAVRAGMADRVGSLATVLSDLQLSAQPSAQDMSMPKNAALAADEDKKDKDDEDKDEAEHDEPDGDECEDEDGEDKKDKDDKDDDDDDEKAAMRATIVALQAQLADGAQRGPTAEEWTDAQVKKGYPAAARATLLELRRRRPKAAEKSAADVLATVGQHKRQTRLTAGGAPVGTTEERAATTARAGGKVSVDEQAKIKAHAQALLNQN